MTPDHVTRVEGDYLTGWRWLCTCGTQSALYGDSGAPKRASGAHKRWKRAKEQCAPMGTNARGVAQCDSGHGDYPDACNEAKA